MSDIYIAFGETDTGLIKDTDVTLDVCRYLSTGLPVGASNWVLTEYGRGFYKVTVPETALPIFVVLTNIKVTPNVTVEATSGEGWATIPEIAQLLADSATTAEQIRSEIDAHSTRLLAISNDTQSILGRFDAIAPGNVFSAASFANLPSAQVVGGIGTGNVLFKWYEYDLGYQGDPAHAVSGVICAVYNNENAEGDVEASAVTDEAGCATMWLNAGTYYLFRRKAGRAFLNPTRVTVSHTVGDSVEEDELALGYIDFTWYEYASGHEGDPNYAVPDVDVLVHSDIGGAGDPLRSERTDATGMCRFRLPAGTYYLFRSAVGRVFTNPVEIEVS